MLASGVPTSDAGWSSPVARWAHNPKVAGSNPAPATKFPLGNELVEETGSFCFRQECPGFVRVRLRNSRNSETYP